MTPTADLMKLVEDEETLERVAQVLKDAGWRATCDGQWDRLAKALPDLQAALSATGEARVGGEVVDGLRAEMDAALEAARAWRSRFVCERMNAYPNDAYEVCRAKAEDSANQFEDAFKAARLPKEKES